MKAHPEVGEGGAVFAPALTEKTAKEGRRVREIPGYVGRRLVLGVPRSPATTHCELQCVQAPRVLVSGEEATMTAGDDDGWRR